MSIPGRVLALMALGLGFVPSPRAGAAESDFGPRPITTLVPAKSFVPRTSVITWDDDIDAYRNATALTPPGSAVFTAALDLPDGVQVSRVERCLV